MSDTLTRLNLPGQRAGFGILDWGVRTPEEMVSMARRYADRLREDLRAFDEASDEDFQIDIVRGSAAQRFVREVQTSARAALEASK